jgi:hypothetical protein
MSAGGSEGMVVQLLPIINTCIQRCSQTLNECLIVIVPMSDTLSPMETAPSNGGSTALNSEISILSILLDCLHYEDEGDRVSCFPCPGFSRHFSCTFVCLVDWIHRIESFGRNEGQDRAANYIELFCVPSSIEVLSTNNSSNCVGWCDGTYLHSE